MAGCKGCGHYSPEECTECLGYNPFPSDAEMRADYQRIMMEEAMRDKKPCSMCGSSKAVLDGLCRSCTIDVTGLTGEEVDSLINHPIKGRKLS